jgi:hypothetical protein
VLDLQGNILSDCEMVPPCERSAPTPAQEVANARRICAAVNACAGLSTEALEQGAVAGLRHALETLLDAAADLDAAIDGTTDQFDPERARLNAALRGARACLDAGPQLDLHGLLAARGQIALGWSVEDVLEVRPDLTNEQAWEVLQQVERRHDASIGINWDTLEWVADDLFGDAPDTATEEGQPGDAQQGLLVVADHRVGQTTCPTLSGRVRQLTD